MAFNSKGDPVVAFGEAGKVSVYAYDGAGKWQKMGIANIVDGATDISLAIGPNDIAYVAIGGNVYVTKLGFDP